MATKLKNDQPITIVAIGSSSTAGAGASSEASTYPSRLAIELTERFFGHPITVLNRVGGEEVRDMFKRFDTDVIAAARRQRRAQQRAPTADPLNGTISVGSGSGAT